MPTLPAASAFTGSTVTEAQFKTAITDEREFLAGLLGTAGTQSAALTAMGAPLNGISSKSANYTVLTTDRGKLIDYTAAPYTATLPTAATAGAGFVLSFRNSAASGVLTVGRNAANIDGVAADMTMNPGESCLIVCDGTGWKTVGKAASVAVEVQTFTTVGAATWTKPTRGSIAVIECWGGGGSGAKGSNTLTTIGGGGGGGNYARRIVPLSSLGSTEAVSIGAGGAGKSTAGAGNAGSNTTFGALLTGHGGQGGAYDVALPKASGGGGGAGSNTSATAGMGGYGGGKGGDTSGLIAGQDATYGGGGGGGGVNGTGGAGGNSMFGGGGGGGGGGTGGGAGASLYGGNGSAGQDNSASAAGTQPGGGSGGTKSANTGAGGAGKCVVTVF